MRVHSVPKHSRIWRSPERRWKQLAGLQRKTKLCATKMLRPGCQTRERRLDKGSWEFAGTARLMQDTPSRRVSWEISARLSPIDCVLESRRMSCYFFASLPRSVLPVRRRTVQRRDARRASVVRRVCRSISSPFGNVSSSLLHELYNFKTKRSPPGLARTPSSTS